MWNDTTINYLAVNELNINNQNKYVTLHYSDAAAGDNINNVTLSLPININNYINNTFNSKNEFFTYYSELPILFFNLKQNLSANNVFYFLIFAFDWEDYSFKDAFIYYKNNAFVQWNNTNNDLQTFEISYPWVGYNNYPYQNLMVVCVPPSVPYVAYAQTLGSGSIPDKWYLKSILVVNDDSTLTMPYNHEISGTYTQNFNGSVFKAVSGAITKYKLGRPEKQINWNYKIENTTAFNNATQIQTKQAETGMNLILKEKNKIYFLDADPIQITQEANLVWNVNVAGTEKI